MRSRLLAGVAAFVIALAGLVVAASPASAHCSGHNTHPDEYNAGEISYDDGTRIRTRPHNTCTILGLGFPNHGQDVHCAVETGSLWIFIRNLSIDRNGWSRFDVLRYSDNFVVIGDCVSSDVFVIQSAPNGAGTDAEGPATFYRSHRTD